MRLALGNVARDSAHAISLDVHGCILCTEPLSSYPSAKQMYQLNADRWQELGDRLKLSEDQLEEAKKSPHPTAAVLLAAKVKSIDLTWGHIVVALLQVGEYKLAKSIYNEQGKCVCVCVCVYVVYCLAINPNVKDPCLLAQVF